MHRKHRKHRKHASPAADLRRNTCGTRETIVSGPETSAARVTAELTAEAEAVAGAGVRPVLEVDELEVSVAALLAAGWEHAAGPVNGPGGSQQLLRRGAVFVEVFASGR